jgi:P-type Ca2+ transporter type 2C
MAKTVPVVPAELDPKYLVENACTLESRDVLSCLGTSADGLSDAEAAARLAEIGPNELPEGEKHTVFQMIVAQFKDFLILLLIAAALISGPGFMLLGEHPEWADVIAILVIVVLNATIGVFQEYRAERAMEALREMAGTVASVRRGGRVLEIPSSGLTVGDIVLLDAGRVVPADLRLIDAASLKIAEAALTGESLPADKHPRAIEETEAPIGDRTSMAYKGTQVVYGRGVGVVTAVGLGTELGKIAGLLGAKTDQTTPLQKRLASFGRTLGIVAIGLTAIVFAIGLLRGEDVMTMFMTAVSLAVAAVPEALPAITTISLAFGASRLVKQSVLVRKLPAVETLGSVTYICTDKTGTLTLNKMTVEHVAAGDTTPGALEENGAGAEGWHWLAHAFSLSNDVSGEADALVGDPTEVAFYVAAEKAGFPRARLDTEMPRSAEMPFDSDRKLMTTVHKLPEGGYVSFTKGAAEAIMERATGAITGDGTLVPLDADAADALVEQWSEKGLRVLAFGMRKLDTLPAHHEMAELESNLTVIGYAGLVDPPREEAADAVAVCKTAGIIPVMITGDHPATALAIAKRLGIADHKEQMITGAELDALSLEDFEGRVAGIRVYARVAPEQKLKIVQALQDRGEYVAMTGDGVNDAPALSKAMGITGTDVAKEASDMVLLDDNFTSIVGAVREGRHIFDNIRKFIKYAMAANSGEIWTILLAPLVGLQIPLLPIHILWVNLVTDGLPGLALSSEPAEKNIMRRPPRAPNESIFADGLGLHMVWVGLVMGAATLFTQAMYIDHAKGHWQTMVFTVLCLSQMGHVLAVRSDRESFFRQGFLSNKPLAGAVLLTFVLQLGTIYIPVVNEKVFKTQPLTWDELLVALAISSVVFWGVELEKLIKRRIDIKQAAAA